MILYDFIACEVRFPCDAKQSRALQDVPQGTSLRNRIQCTGYHRSFQTNRPNPAPSDLVQWTHVPFIQTPAKCPSSSMSDPSLTTCSHHFNIHCLRQLPRMNKKAPERPLFQQTTINAKPRPPFAVNANQAKQSLVRTVSTTRAKNACKFPLDLLPPVIHHRPC
jgi:hypothetical protein